LILANAVADDDGIHVAALGGLHDSADRVVRRIEVDVVGSDQEKVGLLSRGERADLVGKAGTVRPRYCPRNQPRGNWWASFILPVRLAAECPDQVARSCPDKLPVLLGNSGVGKSSLAQTGVLSCLRRQSWPETANAGAWPQVFRDSRGWCFLTLRPGAEQPPADPEECR
jgi:hypothetical protein